MVLALEHMHEEGVVYRDLKPENILIDQQGYLRLTDFGLSKVMTKQDLDDSYNYRKATFCGTLEYMAPEMMMNMEYDGSVDWFSFGLVLYEMICGRNPFKISNSEMATPEEVPSIINQLLSKQDNLVKDDGTFSPEAYDLITKLLKYDVSD